MESSILHDDLMLSSSDDEKELHQQQQPLQRKKLVAKRKREVVAVEKRYRSSSSGSDRSSDSDSSSDSGEAPKTAPTAAEQQRVEDFVTSPEGEGKDSDDDEEEEEEKEEEEEDDDDEGVVSEDDDVIDDSYDPDNVHVLGSLLKQEEEEEYDDVQEEFVSLPVKGATADECVIPERVVSAFHELVKNERFQFTQSVPFLKLIKEQVDEAMNSAFSSMLSNSGINIRDDSNGDSTRCGDPPEKKGTSMGRVAKVLSNVATSSNPDNNYRPAATFLQASNSGSSNVKKQVNTDINPQIWNKVIFYREIYTMISLYLSMVYIQRTMNNDNTNSSGYAKGMVDKIFSILGKIPHEEMSREKYVSVGRDALYLYQNVITDMTGPKHYKRLRIPQQQTYFCYMLAMLVNDVPVTSDLSLTGKATNLVQFASAMADPAYRLAVHKMSCLFNSSYSVFKALKLEHNMLVRANKILAVLSTKNNALSERKPRTVTQSVFLYLDPSLKDRLRSSDLTSEESSLGTAVKLVSQQLAFEGVTKRSIDEGCHIIKGSFEDEKGVTHKCLGAGVKDIKIVGLATLQIDRLRNRIKRTLPYY
ncbi:hypothetical protein E2C01_067362 [Portunus trituberculatus]|uniref:Wsv282 n=1 Tax=Portunus trituberculatus TaxID=210409 RepID=A0A5B7HTF2_PORTR|nr:hypothetical protein [Portunus trituberculatus]